MKHMNEFSLAEMDGMGFEPSCLVFCICYTPFVIPQGFEVKDEPDGWMQVLLWL